MFLDAVAHGSVISWQHINRLGEYDFSDEKLRERRNLTPKIDPPKKVKNLGAAEPRYVLQSPGLVENCVRLYVPLLEFNQARRAMEMRPISEDAVEGPDIATSFAFVCAWANQLDLAFEQLNILIKVPGGRLNYGDLKTYPGWDPLRKDPRFDKLLAELAPREPTEKSIAVLPFDNISSNKDDAYFADGV